MTIPAGTQFPDVDTNPTDQPSAPYIIAAGLVVNPGDRLIIRLPSDTGRHAVDVFKAEMRQHFPGTMVVVVAAEQLAVVRGPVLDDPARPLIDLPDDTPDQGFFSRAPLPASVPIPQRALTVEEMTDGEEHN
jgi:hypothetical protein